ncbi:MAG: helix-turn-helix transcriptional regulator, partial [Clostridia bacterium]|nr:helix-turn-helix transcriptional regulator [Clostridia bacterium]
MLFELMGKLSCIYQSDLRGEQEFGKEWYVSRAQKYIIDNIAKPLRVTDVAESLDISTGYLSHLFSEVTGQTVTQYINTVRIKQVEELVISYGMDLKQAGEQVGLSDPSYVSRLFKRIRGCSISDLRHARRKIGDE